MYGFQNGHIHMVGCLRVTSFGPPIKDSWKTPSIGKGVWTWIIPQDFHEGVLFVDQRSTMFFCDKNRYQKHAKSRNYLQEIVFFYWVYQKYQHLPSRKLTANDPEKSWLEDHPFLLNLSLFRGELASFREGRSNRFEARKDDKNPGLTE